MNNTETFYEKRNYRVRTGLVMTVQTYKIQNLQAEAARSQDQVQIKGVGIYVLFQIAVDLLIGF